jgi:hypothetical protein
MIHTHRTIPNLTTTRGYNSCLDCSGLRWWECLMAGQALKVIQGQLVHWSFHCLEGMLDWGWYMLLVIVSVRLSIGLFLHAECGQCVYSYVPPARTVLSSAQSSAERQQGTTIRYCDIQLDPYASRMSALSHCPLLVYVDLVACWWYIAVI